MKQNRLLANHEVKHLCKFNTEPDGKPFKTWKVPQKGRYWIFEETGEVWISRDVMGGDRLCEGIQRKYCVSDGLH